jgi:hypothetical protein
MPTDLAMNETFGGSVNLELTDIDGKVGSNQTQEVINDTLPPEQVHVHVIYVALCHNLSFALDIRGCEMCVENV